MQQQGPRRDTIAPSRWMSGAVAATSNLHEIRDSAVNETNHSEREVRLTPVSPSELSSPSLPEESSRQLRELILQTLRITIHRSREQGSADGSGKEVLAMKREFCATERADDLRVEALILLLTATWWRLPEVHGVTRLDAEITLAELITLCIKEYFAPLSTSTRRDIAVRPANERDDFHFT
jgi:hypothetical protein